MERIYDFRFARLAARSFISMGIPVKLFGSIVPTPFVPFTVCQYQLKLGIMVTASHNPKDDNGYKVFWDNGAQVDPICIVSCKTRVNCHILNRSSLLMTKILSSTV